tara:strand:+ start:141 stop:890 length:750 start_codon:yes stop_codon:yes gene_type:complete
MGVITIDSLARGNQPPNQSGALAITMSQDSVHVFNQDSFVADTNPVYEDPEGDILEAIKVETIPSIGSLELSNVPVSAGDIITLVQLTAGDLTYVSSTSEEGYDDNDMTFLVSDIGSSTFTTTPYNVTFAVKGADNEAPNQVGDGEADVELGETYVFTRASLTSLLQPPYEDPENNDAYQLKVVSVPSQGELRLNGVVVVADQIIDFDDLNANHNIDDGDFTYVSESLGDGLDGFSFMISDTGSQEFRG